MFANRTKIRTAVAMLFSGFGLAVVAGTAAAAPVLPSPPKPGGTPKPVSLCDALLSEWGSDVAGFAGALLQGNQSAMDGFAAAAYADKSAAKSAGCPWAQ